MTTTLRTSMRSASCVLLAVLCLPASGAPTPESPPPAPEKEPQRPRPIDLCRPLVQEGRFAEAEALARRLLEEAQAAHGTDSLEAAEALDAVVGALWVSKKTDDADVIRLGERAVAIKEKLLGPGDPAVAASLNSLANVHFDRGEYGVAGPQYERALAIREAALGPRHVMVAKQTANLARFRDESGDHAAARPLFERALSQIEAAKGPEHEEVAIVLNNFAIYFKNLGDFQAARPLFERAIRIQEKALGPESAAVAGTLGNLGNMLRLQGDLESAGGAYERALDILEKHPGQGNRDLATGLENLANLHLEAGDPGRAEALSRRSLAIRESYAGPEHHDLAPTLTGLGRALLRSGRPAEAGAALERALRIRTRVYGSEHRVVASTLVDLAQVDWRLGESGRALDRAITGEAIAREQFVRLSRSLSEREALQYEITRASGLGVAASVLAAGGPGGPVVADAARVWDGVIRSRALVLEELAERRRAVAGGDDPRARRLQGELAIARNRLARLAVRGPEAGAEEDYPARLQRARDARDRAERDLAAASGGFRRRRDRLQAGLSEVVRAIPSDAALVAFAQFERLDRAAAVPAAPWYLAFVARPGRAPAMAVPLGPAVDLDAIIRSWMEEASTDPRRTPAVVEREAAVRRQGSRLRAAIWDPIRPHLGGARLVFVVPDGEVSLVSFAALPEVGDGYLVESGPPIHYLAAERDLIRDALPPATGRGLLALGGPDFDAPVLPAQAQGPPDPQGAPAPAFSESPRSTYRSPPAVCPSYRTMTFEPLDAAREEAERVAALWARRRLSAGEGPAESLVLTGAAASEAAFKERSPGRRILHVATHGYFLHERCGSATDADDGPRGSASPGSTAPRLAPSVDNPLLLSGLALAGANRRADLRADALYEDGILTAEEIAALDLDGTEWVVLSACETAVGSVVPGEGVLGLRHALAVSGAGTLISSLWTVEEEAASAWMESLYTARLSGRSTVESVRGAALDLLERQRRSGRTTHPFLWGAFVASGDWR